MKHFIRLFVISGVSAAVLLLSGCGSSGGGYRYGNNDVYNGYNYPYYGNGGYYRYDDDRDRPDRPIRPDRPDRPDRPLRPNRPVTLPAARPAGGMGRPSGMSRGGGGGGRGGGRGR